MYKLPHFSLQKAIKEALCAYVRNEDYLIAYSNDSNVDIPKAAQFHICLDENCDKDVIQWLKTTSSGYRNSLIKNITRKYLENPGVYPYVTTGIIPTAENKVKTEKKSENKTNLPKKEYKEIKTENINEKNGEALVKEVLHSKLPEANPNVKLHEADEVLSEEKEKFDLTAAFNDMMNSFM